MNNVDRILRVIYRELNLNDLIHKIKYFSSYNDSYYLFTFGNREFLEMVAMKYSTVYPKNYSYEEVLSTLSYYNDFLKKISKDENPDFFNLFHLCAEQLFIRRDNRLLVSFDKLLEWDGICNKVDANIVIGAYMARYSNGWDHGAPGAVIRHDNSNINSILRNGAADLHMHFNASGYSVEMSWACLITCSIYEEKNLEDFVRMSSMIQEGFCVDVAEGVGLLKKIKIIRLILEELLDSEKSGKKSGEKLKKEEIIDLLTSSSDGVYLRYDLWIEKNLYKLEEKFRNKGRSVKKYFMIEREFLADVFKYFINHRVDPIYAFLFDIYLAGLSQVRFFFVQDNNGMGFEKFKFRESVKDDCFKLETINKNKIVRGNDLCRSVFDRCYETGCMKYAEFRIAPKSSKDLQKFFQRLEKANEKIFHQYEGRTEKLQYGVVIHFIKQKECPQPTDGTFRWEKLRQEISRQADILISYVDKKYRNYEKLVGIDAANYEVNCRPEVFSDTFRKIRNTVAEQKKFGFTFHVGESFETLCSGLRAIDETIVFMNFGDGDRLGHAIALGIDVELFRQAKRNQITLTLGAYVDDLAWMYYTLKSNSVLENSALLMYLENQFDFYKTKLFYPDKTNHISIDEYIDSWILRGDSPSVFFGQIAGESGPLTITEKWEINHQFPDHDKAFKNKQAIDLYKIYLFDSKFYKNSGQSVCIEPAEEYWTALSLVQSLIHKKIYEKRISIETNPSSNRKISPVSKFIDLPFIQFNSFGLSKKIDEKRPDIPISINTDDGSIFQSDLANEYALVAACLQREDYDTQEIYRYIEYLRKSSLVQTFIDE